MNRQQKVLLVISVGALVASWLYPPVIYAWQHNRDFVWHGYQFLFDSGNNVVLWHIDVTRLVLTDAVIAGIGGLILLLLRK